MIITVASFKGGVGKTTAVHLATFFQQQGPTVLIDGDPNRSASACHQRGALPFGVVDERQAARAARQYEHLIIDTEARPNQQDLQALVEGCDQLIIPTTPDALALDTLMLTVRALTTLGADRYRVLITMVPPKPSRDGDEARAMLEAADIPVFATGIRRLVAFQKAALQGVPVTDVTDPRALHGWDNYRVIEEGLQHGRQ